MPEESAAVGAFEATAGAAGERYPVDVARLARDARARARELWRAAPTFPYCERIGISSWEALWCRFEGDGDTVGALRSWAPEFRRTAWSRALADQGVDDSALASELGDRFGVERRRLQRAFPDASLVPALRDRYALALVTNGAACLQREKLIRAGLAEHFDAVVVSADVGAGKPDPAIFEHALSLLGARPDQAVMVGDTLERDIAGAHAAGVRAIWINRFGLPRPADDDVVEISGLNELAAALANYSL